MKVNGKHTILGHSISGVETCLVVPELKAVFDIGYCPPEAVGIQTVFVTHGHPDHLAGAVQHAATRSLSNMAPSKFVVSPALAESLRALFALWNGFQPHTFPAEIIPLAPGQRYPLAKGLFVEAFETEHSMPSQGYMVIRQTSKLKPEYVGLEGSEIGRLRKSGVEVSDTAEAVEFAYTGDTRPTVLEKVPRLQEAETLVMECTFCTSDTVEMAEPKGHTHLIELAHRAPLLEKVGTVVLTHFSQRHKAAEVDDNVFALFAPVPGTLFQRTVLTEIPE